MSSSILASFHYHGSYGATTKEKAADFLTNRFDGWIIDPEWGHGSYEDSASGRLAELIAQAPLSIKHLAKLDEMNPKETLPIDLRQIKELDRIPNLLAYQVDISSEEDYKTHQNVGLVQNSFRNYARQADDLNPNSKVEWNSDTSSDIFSQNARGKKASELYTPDGSAAGKISNRLNETGYTLDSVNFTVAF